MPTYYGLIKLPDHIDLDNAVLVRNALQRSDWSRFQIEETQPTEFEEYAEVIDLVRANQNNFRAKNSLLLISYQKNENNIISITGYTDASDINKLLETDMLTHIYPKAAPVHIANFDEIEISKIRPELFDPNEISLSKRRNIFDDTEHDIYSPSTSRLSFFAAKDDEEAEDSLDYGNDDYNIPPPPSPPASGKK